MKAGHPDCQDAGGTKKFIRAVDRLFDILNTKSLYEKGFTKPLF